jgi:hypothetical protein
MTKGITPYLSFPSFHLSQYDSLYYYIDKTDEYIQSHLNVIDVSIVNDETYLMNKVLVNKQDLQYKLEELIIEDANCFLNVTVKDADAFSSFLSFWSTYIYVKDKYREDYLRKHYKEEYEAMGCLDYEKYKEARDSVPFKMFVWSEEMIEALEFKKAN